ncbi:hypothetical protein GOV08_02695, partial [Candidatus Woesearchaeota archaeon]|nr:hypothetical protein [Candidatus Woesearchaeota archaeon]
FVFVNGNATHNLSVFNPQYEFLGDPFIAGFNPSLLTPGSEDNITIRTGIDSGNSTGCSANSTFYYTGLMKASVSYSDVLEFAQGCNWTVQFEDNTYADIAVPPDYNGSNVCFYTNSSTSYNINDTYDDAMYNLMKNLDLDRDGRIDINLVENNLVINAISLHKVPYPWGPAIAEVRVWQ